jgi:glycosyltransferase involved in cell wall biosynthesis
MERWMIQSPALISIITPSYNRMGLIEQAIQSVLAQNYPCLEHIIIDGSSTDATLDLLAHYPHLKVISEPDRGMYDALNKGIKLARGEIIGFLNTDDLYAPAVFQPVAELFGNAEVDAVAGRADIFGVNEAGDLETISEIPLSSPDHLLEQMVFGPPGFNAWFFRRSLFGRIGVFDEEYRISGDREFMIRLALAGIVYERVDWLIYHYRRHTGALTFNWDGEFFSEIVQEHLKMTDGFLQNGGLREKAKRYFRNLRTRDTVEVTISLLHRRQLAKAWFFASAGLRTNWGWPLNFISQGFSRLTHPRKSRIF